MRKENPPKLALHIEAAQLQRQSTDAVMIPADVLTTHFGIH
jgi:hypothetical protein